MEGGGSDVNESGYAVYTGNWMVPMHERFALLGLALALAACTVAAPARAFSEETPALLGDHGFAFSLLKSSGSVYSAESTATQSLATQLALGAGPVPGQIYLYVSSATHGIRRLDYDPLSGALSNRVDVLPALLGNGVALRNNGLGQLELYASESYFSANSPTSRLSRLRRFIDLDGDGVFAGVGDVDAAIARGIPHDDHGMNQIQIDGDTLYVGYGIRTRNGALQTFSGDAFGESAFGGAILVIDDLEAVATLDDAAGFPAYLPDPTLLQYEQIIDGTAVGTEVPYTSVASDKLRVHSSGARNPFGLALDAAGDLWFTVNFQRVNNSVFDRSIVGATADVDAFDGASNDDIHDQMFRALDKADYGYRNGNWQSNPAAQGAGFFAGIADPAQITASHTFDNYDPDGAGSNDTDSIDLAYDAFHDPSLPVGLGPHAAVTGLAFAPSAFADSYQGGAFVARWNGQFGILDGLDYRDVVWVRGASGKVERVIRGFTAPIDVLDDGNGHLLIASHYGSIWRLSATQALPSGRWAPLWVAMMLGVFGAVRAGLRPRV